MPVKQRRIQQKPILVKICDFKKYFKTNIKIWHDTIVRKIEKGEEKNNFWELVTENVSDDSIYELNKTCYSSLRYLHPLIKNREAYWIDANTLLKGYILKNTQVFRPIFSFPREKNFKLIRDDIVKFAKLFSSRSRNYLYKQALMENTKLPEEIIDEIVLFAWDILLLL